MRQFVLFNGSSNESSHMFWQTKACGGGGRECFISCTGGGLLGGLLLPPFFDFVGKILGPTVGTLVVAGRPTEGQVSPLCASTVEPMPILLFDPYFGLKCFHVFFILKFEKSNHYKAPLA